MVLYGYSIVASISWAIIIIYLLIGQKKIKALKDQPAIDTQPAVAVIIAVRNEEEDVEKALHSICNINYQNYCIIVVNDRSTDNTAEILKRFNHPRLSILTIETLPDGWLGKNNALYQGYKSSSEEWLLFTDADVEFHPDSISKALGYAVKNKLDNLAILPHVVSPSAILNSVLATFSIMLLLFMRPWNAKSPRSGASVGVGAFNLVKRDAYEKAGTHIQVKLRPDDDVKLGRNIKRVGLLQDVLGGKGYIRLEWYKNLKQFKDGLLKNTFAVAEYNLFRSLLNIITVLVCIALPVPVMLIWGTADIRLMACFILMIQVIYMIIISPNKWWYAFMIPYAGFLMAYIILKATIITLKQGGIYWRDSFYSLSMLKGEGE
jgi:glycosyltransferase involved in cell wall biosynthesis